MKKLWIVLALIGVVSSSVAQKTVCVAFYNQENLFDTINDPNKNDEEFLPGSKKDWNTTKYNTKINNMSSVVASMNNNLAPDILGMCEVENKAVLNDLCNTKNLKKHKYHVVHLEGPDDRSIDNALLFKSSAFKLLSTQHIKVNFQPQPNFKTRDILLVKLQAKNKAELFILVNHFPSRSGGEAETEPKRWAAAQTLRNVCDSLLQLNGLANLIILGDFNDEPTNKSMDSVLRAKSDLYDLNNGNLFNAMYEMKNNGLGTHYYKGNFSMLDQIVLSTAVANCSGKICYVKNSADIYKQPWMVEQGGKYKGAPLRTYFGDKYMGGYSDHLPVYLMLELRK